jgi:3-deoxy-D-manno-octulosonate 8-phosphate phosphatase (KDO 8-P phosphatase)
VGAIRAIALDVDGVLTDGGFWWGPDGAESKRFSFLDVMGVAIGTRAGLVFALISGEDSPLVDRFAAKLSIGHVYKGCKDKGRALREFSAAAGIPLEAIAFMGDDINDFPAMDIAGLSAAPASAREEVRARVAYVAPRPGGDGAVRELVERVLALRGAP